MKRIAVMIAGLTVALLVFPHAGGGTAELSLAGPWTGKTIEVTLRRRTAFWRPSCGICGKKTAGTLEVEGRKSALNSGTASLLVMREDTNDGKVTFRAVAGPGTTLTLLGIEFIPQ